MFVALLALSFGGCAVIQRLGIAVLYKEATLPKAQTVLDVSYAADGVSEPKHRLDLFLPKGTNWPALIFVHGGNWDAGDKSLRVGGADVYRNIGRFFAARGVGVAVINYRLQPKVSWREQVADVAKATAWVHSHIAKYGGDPRSLFLSGHSAGAQLASYVALNPEPLAQAGISSKLIRGVISVSGAGLDLTEEKSHEPGKKMTYYEQRFNRDNSNEDWRREASATTYVSPDSPPFLILFGGDEKSSLQKQSHLLHEKLSAQGIENKMIKVPGQSHSMMVLTLSRPDKISAPAMLDFIESKRTR